MSKLINLIIENYEIDESFSPHDFSTLIGKDLKICQMALRRLSNNLKLGRHSCSNGSSVFYRISLEESNKRRVKENELIDKLNLKNKKFKLLKKL